MGFGGIGSDDKDQLGQIKILNGIGCRRRAQSFHHAGHGRAVAHPCAVVDMIAADHAAHEFAEEIILFVRAAAGGDRRQRIRPVGFLDATPLLSNSIEGRRPGEFNPLVALPQKRRAQPVRRIIVGPPESSLHACMAVIGRPVIGRSHPDDPPLPHTSIECATDTAIGTGGANGLHRLALFKHGLLDQGPRRTFLHARPAGDAIR